MPPVAGTSLRARALPSLKAAPLESASLGFASHFHEFIAIEFPIAIFIVSHRHVDEVFGARAIHSGTRTWSTWPPGRPLGSRSIGWLSHT